MFYIQHFFGSSVATLAENINQELWNSGYLNDLVRKGETYTSVSNGVKQLNRGRGWLIWPEVQQAGIADFAVAHRVKLSLR